MTALANQHLTDLQHHLHTKRLTRDLRSRTTPPELARLTRVLARYHDQIADGFGVPHPASAGVRDGAHRAAVLIKQAEHLLGPPADTETPQSALAQKLRAASIALGCGLDLLTTHFPVSTDQATSTNAVVIAAPDTARALLHQLSTHTATAGHLAGRLTPPTHRAGGLLLKAAVLTRIYGQATPPPINAVPLHLRPERIPPTIGEDSTQALTGMDASIHRLSHPETLTSITTWRYLARAAAIICDLNTRTLRQLIYRTKELDEPDHAAALATAAARLSQTSTQWKAIIRHWNQHTGHYGHPANGPATDAGDLIVRQGRLIHADPAWTPSPRACPRLKEPHQLAPDLAQAAHIATITLKTIEACNIIAAHHHTAINDAATLGVLHHQQRHPTHLPRIPAAARHLQTAYKTAETQGCHTITTLGQTIQALTQVPHHHTEKVHLIIHRTTANNEQHQAELAATDFPNHITECLNHATPAAQSPSDSSPPSTTSHKARSPKKHSE